MKQMIEDGHKTNNLIKEQCNELELEIVQMKRDFFLTENEENELLINSKLL